MVASLANYEGREQTYVKHFFLNNYLERLVYNLLSNKSRNEFVYVDGFSGPWQSATENFNDTSVHIALSKLDYIRRGYAEAGRSINFRAIFVEKNRNSFAALESVLARFPKISSEPLRGEFEQKIPDVIKSIGGAFSLVFIDPTGWTGFGLQSLRSILSLPGEVLINFMYDYINHYIEDYRPGIAASFDPLFGEQGWYEEINALVADGTSREDAILEVYKKRLRSTAGYAHVTSTQIKKALADRTYFHLVYGTRHWKGVYEFREAERKTSSAQSEARSNAQLLKKEKQTGIVDLFGSSMAPLASTDDAEFREKQIARAKKILDEIIPVGTIESYAALAGHILELPMFWPGDLSNLVMEYKQVGKYEVIGMTDRERTFKSNHHIRRLK